MSDKFITGPEEPFTIERDGAELTFNSPQPGSVTIRWPHGPVETITMAEYEARTSAVLM